MTAIGFAKNLKALLKGAKRVVIVAPKRNFGAKRYPKLLGKKLDGLAVELAKGVSAGDLGGSASTLTGKDPHTLAVCVLPDSVSRHNTPSRAEAIRRTVQAAGGGRGKTAVILMLDDAAHCTAGVNAVGRAFPQFTAKTGRRSRGRVQILAVGTDGKQIEIPEIAQSTMAATRDMAEFVDTPPTELNPTEYARRAREMLEAHANVEITEYVGDELLDHGLGGIHAVGRAAVEAPRMLVATEAVDAAVGALHGALITPFEAP